MPSALTAGLIGFVSGVLSGAFGIGGGIITTPALRLILGAPALIAVGTPLPVIIPSAVTGAIQYVRRGSADVRAGLWLGAAGALTAVAGALLAGRAGGTVVLLGTAALILYAAVDTILQIVRPVAPHPDTAEEAEAALPPGEASGDNSAAERPLSSAAEAPLVRLAVIGAITGLYSGFFGLGGGFVLVPLLTRWLRFPVKRAIGTSLVAVALLAIPGTVTHALLGHIDWTLTAALIVGVIPGAYLGAHITLGTADRPIRIAFATLLVLTGLWLATSEIWGLVR